MARPEPGLTADPEALLARLAERQEVLAAPHPHRGPTESVREATYKGHHIVVRTTYTVEVDGVPIEGHLAVTNDGDVHYHAVPNLGFGSALDLVKMLIDAFPDDFPDAGHADHGAADHGHADQGAADHGHGRARER